MRCACNCVVATVLTVVNQVELSSTSAAYASVMVSASVPHQSALPRRCQQRMWACMPWHGSCKLSAAAHPQPAQMASHCHKQAESWPISSNYTPHRAAHLTCALHVRTCLQDGSYDLSAAPPFGLSDIREAIPKQCWEKNSFKSMAYLAADVAIVGGLAAGAFALNQVTHCAVHAAAVRCECCDALPGDGSVVASATAAANFNSTAGTMCRWQGVCSCSCDSMREICYRAMLAEVAALLVMLHHMHSHSSGPFSSADDASYPCLVLLPYLCTCSGGHGLCTGLLRALCFGHCSWLDTTGEQSCCCPS
jgi:hypothetical protein